MDLGQTTAVNHIQLVWEAAYGQAYQIQTSNDGVNWTTIYATTTGIGGVDDFEWRVAGVNHLIWLLDMTIRGQDGLQMVRDFVREGRSVPLPPGRGEWHEPFVDRWKLKLELFDPRPGIHPLGQFRRRRPAGWRPLSQRTARSGG